MQMVVSDLSSVDEANPRRELATAGNVDIAEGKVLITAYVNTRLSEIGS